MPLSFEKRTPLALFFIVVAMPRSYLFQRYGEIATYSKSAKLSTGGVRQQMCAILTTGKSIARKRGQYSTDLKPKGEAEDYKCRERDSCHVVMPNLSPGMPAQKENRERDFLSDRIQRPGGDRKIIIAEL